LGFAVFAAGAKGAVPGVLAALFSDCSSAGWVSSGRADSLSVLDSAVGGDSSLLLMLGKIAVMRMSSIGEIHVVSVN
jgi:hypothetical protein